MIGEKKGGGVGENRDREDRKWEKEREKQGEN